MPAGRCYLYILANRPNGVLYVGSTGDIVRRISEHRGNVPGFTSDYGVNKLVYFEEYASILDARQREHTLKRWRRAWKISLVEKMNPEWRDLSDHLTP